MTVLKIVMQSNIDVGVEKVEQDQQQLCVRITVQQEGIALHIISAIKVQTPLSLTHFES